MTRKGVIRPRRAAYFTYLSSYPGNLASFHKDLVEDGKFFASLYGQQQIVLVAYAPFVFQAYSRPAQRGDLELSVQDQTRYAGKSAQKNYSKSN